MISPVRWCTDSLTGFVDPTCFQCFKILFFMTALRRIERSYRFSPSGMRSPQETTGVALGERQAKGADFPVI